MANIPAFRGFHTFLPLTVLKVLKGIIGDDTTQFNGRTCHEAIRYSGTEVQHTPGAYPRDPQNPKWKEFLHTRR